MRRATATFWAAVLIGAGGYLIYRQAGGGIRFGLGGPLLIVLGAWLAIRRGSLRRWAARGLAVPLGLVALGVVWLLHDLGTIPRTISVGPILLIAAGVAVLLAALPRRTRTRT